MIDQQHRTTLLSVAADSVKDVLATGHASAPDLADCDEILRSPAATFVTLERGPQLLGCIGSLEPVRPLVVDVAHNSVAAAFSDPRLPPVTVDDFVCMSIKVSLLSEPEPIPVDSYEELLGAVRPGVDGWVLEAGRNRATLLPSVWSHSIGAADFLDALWRKAGLTPGVWPNRTVVSRYTTEEFEDPGPRDYPSP
jgi:AmmeMemoRadiSam system protein A